MIGVEVQLAKSLRQATALSIPAPVIDSPAFPAPPVTFREDSVARHIVTRSGTLIEVPSLYRAMERKTKREQRPKRDNDKAKSHSEQQREHTGAGESV